MSMTDDIRAALARYDSSYRGVYETRNATQEVWHELKEAEADIDGAGIGWLRFCLAEIERLKVALRRVTDAYADQGGETDPVVAEARAVLGEEAK